MDWLVWPLLLFALLYQSTPSWLKVRGDDGVVVAHMILVSAQVLLVLTLRLWTLGLQTRAWQFFPKLVPWQFVWAAHKNFALLFCKLLILTKCAEVNLLSEKELDNFLGKDEHAIKCEVSLFLNLVLTDRIWWKKVGLLLYCQARATVKVFFELLNKQ